MTPLADPNVTLEAVPGAVIDKEFVAVKVAELNATHEVELLAFDPAGMADFIAACERIGLAAWRWEGADKPEGVGLKLVSHAQGTRVVFEDRQLCMPRSVERLEDRILTVRVTIAASPVTYWCAGNAALVADAQKNRAFDKKRSRGRIDGLVTIAMGVGAATMNEAPAAGPSVYETRSIRAQVARINDHLKASDIGAEPDGGPPVPTGLRSLRRVFNLGPDAAPPRTGPRRRSSTRCSDGPMGAGKARSTHGPPTGPSWRDRPEKIPHPATRCGIKTQKPNDFNKLEISWCPGKESAKATVTRGEQGFHLPPCSTVCSTVARGSVKAKAGAPEPALGRSKASELGGAR